MDSRSTEQAVDAGMHLTCIYRVSVLKTHADRKHANKQDLAWGAKQGRKSYSACRIGSSASYWAHDANVRRFNTLAQKQRPAEKAATCGWGMSYKRIFCLPVQMAKPHLWFGVWPRPKI
jgi:hypothetical protein